jgi:hypothetical protein
VVSQITFVSTTTPYDRTTNTYYNEWMSFNSS